MTSLELIHRRTGEVIICFNRFLVAVMVLGSIFMASVVGLMLFLEKPESYLKVQAFQINYLENKQDIREAPSDPNWDGILSGAGMGYTYGRAIPVFGPMTGAILGGFVGYQMDSRI